jgi:transmembrane protein EpsG
MERYIFVILALVLLLPATFSKSNKRINLIFFYGFALLSFFVFAFRFETGTDWGSYRRLYENFSAWSDYPEIGFQALMLVCRWLGFSYVEFIFISTLPFLLLLHSVKTKNNTSFLLLLGIIAFLGLFFLGGIRQGISISLFAYGCRLLSRGIFSYSAICLILSSLFHYSALYASFLLFLLFIVKESRGFALLLPASMILGVLPLPESVLTLSEQMGFSYLADNAVGVGSTSRNILLYSEWLISAALALVILYKSKELDSENKAFVVFCAKACILGACIFFVFWQHSRMTAGRLSGFFRFAECVVLVSVIDLFPALIRLFSRGILSSYLAIRIVVVTSISNPYYIPYSTFFWKSSPTASELINEQ